MDEEREYLIEEIKFKDSELERKNGEIKAKDDTIKDARLHDELKKKPIEKKTSTTQSIKNTLKSPLVILF